MGWDFGHATHYTSDLRVDRKAEVEALFDSRYKVLKSVFVGSTCYVALLDTQTLSVHADIILTKTNNREYFNFGYKAMGEEMGPCERDCPASILNLLTATDDEWALEWREDCRKNIEKKKSPSALKNLAIGSMISCTIAGRNYKLQKMAPNRQFKRAWWYIPDSNKYMPARRIPAEYEVVSA